MSTFRMSCGEASEKLPLYVGGDLDPEVLAAVRAHLDACPGCARRAGTGQRARQELADALGTSEGGMESPGLWPGIRAALRAEGLIHAPAAPSERGRSRALRPVRRMAWLAPLAAAAVVVGVLQLSGVFGRAPRVLPAPQAGPPEIELVTPVKDSPAGGLRPIDPFDVQPLVPFQGQRQRGDGPVPAGEVSAAGYGRVR